MLQGAKRVWKDVKASLSGRISSNQVELWIEPLVPLAVSTDEVILGCPNRFSLNWIRQNHLKEIREAFSGILGKEPEVTLRVYVSKKSKKRVENNDLLQMDLIAPPPDRGPVFNRNFTFHDFVVGDSNRFAFASTQALALGSLPSNSLLLLLAAPGLGKSHLACAVGNTIMERTPGTRICYLTAEEFTGEVVAGVRGNCMDRVKDKFRRRCEVLLLEDMHFLVGKTKIQEEVIYTLDALLSQGRRVLLTSVRPPNDIPALKRLRSRLGSGLMVKIAPPDFDTRRRIISRKAEKEGLYLKEDVKDLMAQHLTGDIRLLEACVINLAAQSSLLGIPVALGLAEEVLASVAGKQPPLNISDIQSAVGREFEVTLKEMRSKSRKRNLVYPRKLSMYLCRKYTQKSLKEIGQAFNRAHATVVSAVDSIERLKRTEPEVGRDINRLKRIIEERGG